MPTVKNTVQHECMKKGCDLCYNIAMKNTNTPIENNSKKTQYRKSHFTENERIIVENYLKCNSKQPLKDSIKRLSDVLCKHPKTIKREIERGTVDQLDAATFTHKKCYFATVGERKSRENAETKGRKLKIGSDINLADRIEYMLKVDKYSPFAIVAKLDKEGWNSPVTLSEKTIYNYIENGVFFDVSRKDLPLKGKRKKSEHIKKRQHCRAINSMHSIENRPKEIEKREEFGHWEGDTVVSGRKGKGCLLTFTERCTRYEIIVKIPNKKSESVINALNKIEKKLGNENFKNIFKTITFDNGCEFNDANRLENSCIVASKRTTIYYTHPYVASERGTNENHNGIIRRFIPKGEDISKCTKKYIKRVQNWMNFYPRKIFLGDNPIERIISKKELCPSCLSLLLKI